MNTKVSRNLRALSEQILSSRVLSAFTSVQRKVTPPRHSTSQLPLSFSTALAREFDQDWYRKTYLQSEPTQDALQHYFQYGMKAGNSPNELFDESFYISFYADVRESVANGRHACGFHHFLSVGRAENRLPHRQPSPQSSPRVPLSFSTALGREFDPDWYRKTYLQSEPRQDALEHYLQHGMKAGNSPNEWFDETFYVSFYSDVRESVVNGQYACGFHHFLTDGREENRLFNAEASPQSRSRPPQDFFTALSREFDQAWYQKTYLQSQPTQDALEHYLHHGMKAGNSPNEWFDETFYTSFYSDVRESVTTGRHACGFHHFLSAGREENRLSRFELQKALEARMPG